MGLDTFYKFDSLIAVGLYNHVGHLLENVAKGPPSVETSHTKSLCNTKPKKNGLKGIPTKPT